MIAKAVFTMIDDSEGEKITTVIEYGPYETGDKHCVEALFDFMQTLGEESKEESKLIL